MTARRNRRDVERRRAELLAEARRAGSAPPWGSSAGAGPLTGGPEPLRASVEDDGKLAGRRVLRGGWDGASGRARLRRRHRQGPRRGGAVGALVVGAVVGLLGFGAGVVVGAPVLGHPWRIWWLVSGMAVGALGATWAVHGAHRCSWIPPTVVGALSTLVLVSLIWGGLTSVVVDGHVYFNDSPTAEAYHTEQSLITSLSTMASEEPMLTASPDWQSAHYESYAGVQSSLQAMTSAWTQAGHQPMAVAALANGVQATANAAYWEEQAYKYTAENIATPDTTLSDKGATSRSDYLISFDAAVRDLRVVNREEHFTLRLPGLTAGEGTART